MGQSVLVVGGSGYVGGEICRQLLERGDQVQVLDNTPPPRQDEVLWIKADFTDQAALEAALAGRKFDAILHIASLPGDTGNPAQMIQVNVVGLTHMLDWARRCGVTRFVHTSSISAYEWYPATKFCPPDYMPVDEEHPCRPRDMYSSSKYMQEILVKTFHHQYGMATTSLRLAAVVGPGGKGGGRGWRAIAEALAQGERVQIPHFSLDEVCHYVDIRDVARMHLVAMEAPGAIGQIFNCCGPRAVSGYQMAGVIQKLFPGVLVETGFPWSMAQGGQIAFDMSKAKKLMDFEPLYDIEDSFVAIKQWILAGGLEEGRSDQDKAYGSGVKA